MKRAILFKTLFFFIQSSSVVGQITDYSSSNFFHEVDIDINQLIMPVQTTTGRQDLVFYSYYAVLNSERVNQRAFSDLTGLYSRKNLYINLIDELTAQAELSPFYVLKNNYMDAISSVRQKKDALLFTFPIMGVSDELYPVIEEIMDSGLDEPIDKGLSIVGEVLSGIDQATDLPHLKEAMNVLDGVGLALSSYRLLDDAKKMAISFTLFMALDLEMYRVRLETIKQLSEIDDPAFWYAIYEIEKRLALIDRSYWLRTYQFAIENMDELLSLQYQSGMLALNSIKAKLGASMSKFVPWIGASAFAYGQYKMAAQHRRSLAYGTLAGTLYKDLEGKDAGLQSYLGYVYLRERNAAFRNWTTSVFSFLNLNSWDEVLKEFERGYHEYKQSWMQVFLDQFFEERVQIVERDKELSICDVWSVANSGGVEGTIDRWDISVLPEGVMLDIRYDMKRVPDKLTLKYPENNVLLETGWRGSSSYAGFNYPGGIAGPGIGTELDVFRKESSNYFIVEVIGVDDGTYWEYQVRCREDKRSYHTFTHNSNMNQPEEPDLEISEPAVVERQRETDSTLTPVRFDSDFLASRESNSGNKVQQEDIETEVIWITGSNEEEVDEDKGSRSIDITPKKDYRTKQLLSFDYSNIIRTNSSIFRNDNLVSASNGYTFSITAYILDGFRSARGGLTYLSSNGTTSAFTNSGFVEETFNYSHVSLYVSYAPSFEMFDSRTTYLVGYVDIGASAIIANLTYNDYEEVFDGNFIDIFETDILIENEWFPGMNIGAGVIFNYKYLGVHLGFMTDLTFIEELNTSIANFFPQIGVNIRRR